MFKKKLNKKQRKKCYPTAERMEILIFLDLHDTYFKIKWLKRSPFGSLSFILKCNYIPPKLPIALSKFHQQCLLTWKLCYIHSFSPHRTFRNKLLFSPRWFQNNINCILSLFDNSGNILTYERFMTYHSFPIPPIEFNKVIKAISPGFIHLVKSNVIYSPSTRLQLQLNILYPWKEWIC